MDRERCARRHAEDGQKFSVVEDKGRCSHLEDPPNGCMVQFLNLAIVRRSKDVS